MAKDKKSGKGKGGGGKKAKKAKLPKEIAGVKVPRQLRESGGKLLEAVANPLVIDLAAAALFAAAAGMRDGKGLGAARRPTPAPDPTQDSAARLGAALAATAVEGLRKIVENKIPRNGGAGSAPATPVQNNSGPVGTDQDGTVG